MSGEKFTETIGAMQAELEFKVKLSLSVGCSSIKSFAANALKNKKYYPALLIQVFVSSGLIRSSDCAG